MPSDLTPLQRMIADATRCNAAMRGTLDRRVHKPQTAGAVTRAKITEALTETPLAFFEVIRATGCAKSSVSDALRAMLADGIVEKRRAGKIVEYALKGGAE